jgi:putative glycosyltransferase (TIGR04372 family)
MTDSTLRRKFSRALGLLTDGLGTLVGTLIILVIRILWPLIRIRFGYFTSDRIGHYAFDVEHYLTERRFDQDGKPTIDLFFFSGEPANTYFTQMCRRSVVVHSAIKWLYSANEILPFGSSHRVLPARVTSDSRDLKGLFSRTGPQLQFSRQENQSGLKFLENVGLRQEDQFVCLAVRDQAYLKQIHSERDWSYHNFRDTKIDTYEAAVVALAERGFWVFRMGKVIHERLAIEHPRVFDYAASKYRSDFLDVWLMANCCFAISTGLGLDSIADIFRRPIVFVNYLPVLDLEAWGRFITVPKSLYWASNQKPLTLYEQLTHTSLNGHYYRGKGIQVRALNPSEITESVLEMEARLSGSWEETDEDIELQNKFWSELRQWPNYSKYHGWIHPEARLGAHYLRRSKDWLFGRGRPSPK